VTVTVADIERVGRDTWSADEQVHIEGWTVSSNGGFTRRVNSATSSGRPDVSLATRDAVREWLAARGCPLVVRVTPLLEASVVDEITGTWGLVAVDPTSVMIRSELEETRDDGITPVDLLDQEFQEDLFSLNARPDAAREPWTRIITRMSERAQGLWVRGTAVGVIAVDSPIGAVYSVAVQAAARRQGWGTRIMEAAASSAVTLGAHTIFLQVLAANHPAVAMYERLRYVEAYRYHYLVPES
jgi:ribosomal protein S18 acetylase RimI-like enzyme